MITVLTMVHSDHAKLLWKRIPQTVKASNPEVGQVWEIGKRLWRRQFTEVYQLIELPTWPSHIAPILACLAGEINLLNMQCTLSLSFSLARALCRTST